MWQLNYVAANAPQTSAKAIQNEYLHGVLISEIKWNELMVTPFVVETILNEINSGVIFE